MSTVGTSGCHRRDKEIIKCLEMGYHIGVSWNLMMTTKCRITPPSSFQLSLDLKGILCHSVKYNYLLCQETDTSVWNWIQEEISLAQHKDWKQQEAASLDLFSWKVWGKTEKPVCGPWVKVQVVSKAKNELLLCFCMISTEADMEFTKMGILIKFKWIFILFTNEMETRLNHINTVYALQHGLQ